MFVCIWMYQMFHLFLLNFVLCILSHSSSPPLCDPIYSLSLSHTHTHTHTELLALSLFSASTASLPHISLSLSLYFCFLLSLPPSYSHSHPQPHILPLHHLSLAPALLFSHTRASPLRLPFRPLFFSLELFLFDFWLPTFLPLITVSSLPALSLSDHAFSSSASIDL